MVEHLDEAADVRAVFQPSTTWWNETGHGQYAVGSKPDEQTAHLMIRSTGFRVQADAKPTSCETHLPSTQGRSNAGPRVRCG